MAQRIAGGASAIGMDALFGAVLGLVHCSKPLMSGDYVASFPLVQRHRVIRMKHRLPEGSRSLLIHFHATKSSASICS